MFYSRASNIVDTFILHGGRVQPLYREQVGSSEVEDQVLHSVRYTGKVQDVERVLPPLDLLRGLRSGPAACQLSGGTAATLHLGGWPGGAGLHVGDQPEVVLDKLQVEGPELHIVKVDHGDDPVIGLHQLPELGLAELRELEVEVLVQGRDVPAPAVLL